MHVDLRSRKSSWMQAACKDGECNSWGWSLMACTSWSEKQSVVVVSDFYFGIKEYRELQGVHYLLGTSWSDVSGLVLAGDFLDDWYLPLAYPAYKDSDAFYRQVIQTSQQVFDWLQDLMNKEIQVTYVTGDSSSLPPQAISLHGSLQAGFCGESRWSKKIIRRSPKFPIPNRTLISLVPICTIAWQVAKLGTKSTESHKIRIDPQVIAEKYGRNDRYFCRFSFSFMPSSAILVMYTICT